MLKLSKNIRNISLRRNQIPLFSATFLFCVQISAAIYCEREGQKGILIGKKGERLKDIGTAARHELERLLGKKVFLELFVKVKPGWRQSASFVEDLDWRRQLENLQTQNPTTDDTD